MDFQLRNWALEEDRLTVWDAEDLDAEPGHIGQAGSPTVVTGLAEAPYPERRRKFLQGSTEEIVQELAGILRKEVEVNSQGGKRN
jgi:electron transfer flavoprotein alpha/beta subunit